MKKERAQNDSRRGFLKLAAVAPAAVVATTVAPEQATAATPTSLGMEKTAHVKKYLAAARF